MGFNSGNYLEKMGLLNIHTPDLSDLQEERKKTEPYCTSRDCTKYKGADGKTKYWARVLKYIHKERCCVDCGSILVWR